MMDAMEASDVWDRVVEIVADAADVPPERVLPDANLYADLGLDSLGAVAVFVGLRAAFGTAEPNSKLEAMSYDTPRKLAELVLSSARAGRPL